MTDTFFSAPLAAAIAAIHGGTDPIDAATWEMDNDYIVNHRESAIAWAYRLRDEAHKLTSLGY